MHVLSVHIEAFKKGVELIAQTLAKDTKLRVVFKGTECFTDGKTIYLPDVALLARRNMTKEQVDEGLSFLAALRGYYDHEVGHKLYTDFEVFKRAYMKGGEKLKHALNVVEDPRIEHKFAKVWAGVGFNFKNTCTYVFDHYGDVTQLTRLQQIFAGWTMAARGYVDHPTYKALHHKTHRFLESREVKALMKQSITAPTTADALEIAERLLELLNEEAKAEKQESQPQQQKGKGKSQKSKSKSKGTSKGKPKAEEEDEDESSGGDPGESDEAEDGSNGSGPGDDEGEGEEGDGDADGSGGGDADEDGEEDGEGSGADGDGDGDFDDGEEEASGGAGADEDFESGGGDEGGGGDHGSAGGGELERDLSLDDQSFERLMDAVDMAETLKKGIPPPDGQCEEYTVYTTEHDHIEPPIIQSVDRSKVEYRTLFDEVGRSTLGVLQRQLRNFLKARSHSYKVRDLKEGKIDRRRLYRLATGMTTHIFQQDVERLELENIAVGLWINESGSMLHVTRLAAQVCLAFAETLDSINVPFEVCGHTTGTPEAQDHMREAQLPEGTFSRFGTLWVDEFKRYDEQWMSVRHRLTKLRAIANTYDAEAVKMAARRVLQRPEERKVIFMLDDGAPCPNWGDDHDKHRRYMRDVVPEIEKAGVEVIGVGIGTNAVKDYYPKHVVVKTVADLGSIVLGELKAVLTKPRQAA